MMNDIPRVTPPEPINFDNPAHEIVQQQAQEEPAAEAPAAPAATPTQPRGEPNWIPVRYKKPGEEFVSYVAHVDRANGLITFTATDPSGRVSTYSVRPSGITVA